MTYIVAYIAAATGFLLLDFLWLGFVAKGFYRQEIGALLLEKFNTTAAIGFYLVFVVGSLFMRIHKKELMQSSDWSRQADSTTWTIQGFSIPAGKSSGGVVG